MTPMPRVKTSPLLVDQIFQLFETVNAQIANGLEVSYGPRPAQVGGRAGACFNAHRFTQSRGMPKLDARRNAGGRIPAARHIRGV